MRKRVEEEFWSLGDCLVPVKIHYEHRRNARVSIGNDAVLVRVPRYSFGRRSEKDLKFCKNWVEELWQDKPETFSGIIRRPFPKTYSLVLLGNTEKITITRHEERRAVIRNVAQDAHRLSLPEVDDRKLSRPKLEKMMMRYFRKRYREPFFARVREINEKRFQLSIGKITLSLAKRNWGSCSSKGNLNFSSRLLLCPAFVVDYIIVHELSHRLEMNHGKKFWHIVNKAMPDYQRAENWLNEQGNAVRFLP